MADFWCGGFCWWGGGLFEVGGGILGREVADLKGVGFLG